MENRLIDFLLFLLILGGRAVKQKQPLYVRRHHTLLMEADWTWLLPVHSNGAPFLNCLDCSLPDSGNLKTYCDFSSHPRRAKG